ncbi:4971_t:CDS:2 [Scutellospora calospora]|uniref:4971_t:CDS:1 n=1 Tax=Scutellospora calospora TaxID=85575 RepID=A0ACA9K9P2_9GLOM|nr:4971_t:CDS:2 [Scutellospora calospora]
MSSSLSNQFSKDWITPWEGTTNSIRVRDIVIARELLKYLDIGKDKNYKQMYSSKKPCVGVIYYGWTDWPGGYRDECCQDANEEFYEKLSKAIDEYDNNVSVNEYITCKI